MGAAEGIFDTNVQVGSIVWAHFGDRVESERKFHQQKESGPSTLVRVAGFNKAEILRRFWG